MRPEFGHTNEEKRLKSAFPLTKMYVECILIVNDFHRILEDTDEHESVCGYAASAGPGCGR